MQERLKLIKANCQDSRLNDFIRPYFESHFVSEFHISSFRAGSHFKRSSFVNAVDLKLRVIFLKPFTSRGFRLVKIFLGVSLKWFLY